VAAQVKSLKTTLPFRQE